MRESDFVLHQVGGCDWAQEREEKHEPRVDRHYTAFVKCFWASVKRDDGGAAACGWKSKGSLGCGWNHPGTEATMKRRENLTNLGFKSRPTIGSYVRLYMLFEMAFWNVKNYNSFKAHGHSIRCLHPLCFHMKILRSGCFCSKTWKG